MGSQAPIEESGLRRCMNAGGCRRRGALCGLAGEHLGAAATLRHLERGERAPPGDAHRLLVHTVHSGLLALCTGLADGRRQIVALAAEGDSLCACSGLGQACWIEALVPSVLCVVDLAADEAALLRRDNGLLNALLRLDHERLESALGRLLVLGSLDGAERACAFLADITRRLGTREAEGWRAPLPLTRQDIADYLGLKPETVSRILGRLKREGLVRFVSRSEFVIPDLAALEARSPLPRHPAARGPLGNARERPASCPATLGVLAP